MFCANPQINHTLLLLLELTTIGTSHAHTSAYSKRSASCKDVRAFIQGHTSRHGRYANDAGRIGKEIG